LRNWGVLSSVIWHCLIRFPKQINYLLHAIIHHMHWQLNRRNAYSRKPPSVTCIINLLFYSDGFWNAHRMVRPSLWCAQQNFEAKLNISVCCNERHGRYILPVARHVQNAILSCKVRAVGLGSAVVKNLNCFWETIFSIGRRGTILTKLYRYVFFNSRKRI
jgi:hypothetical protein